MRTIERWANDGLRISREAEDDTVKVPRELHVSWAEWSGGRGINVAISAFPSHGPQQAGFTLTGSRWSR